MIEHELRPCSKWDITVDQFVNGMWGIEQFILHDSEYEDSREGEIITFHSELLPHAVLHPKYAFAKVTHCEPSCEKVMRIYIDLSSKEDEK